VQLNFTATETRGVTGLLLLCLLIIIAPGLNKKWRSSQAQVAAEGQQAELDALVVSLIKLQQASEADLKPFNPNKATIAEFQQLGVPQWLAERIDSYRNSGGSFKRKADLKKIYNFPEELFATLEPYIELPVATAAEPAPVLFNFNPNTASQAELQQLGLPEWLAQRVVKYRLSGGSFRQKSDLKKIYSFPESLYSDLKPYIQLPEQAAAEEITTKAAPERFPFDPNTATVADLVALGLPQWLAERIEKYRNSGGNFGVKADLQKVYNFPPELYTQLVPYIDLPDTLVKQTPAAVQRFNFDPNTATVAELQQLGLPDWLAERIEKYRNGGGTFRQKSDLQKIYNFPPELYEQLAPFIELPETAEAAMPDLNLADAAALARVPRITFALAKRIVEYRVKLGGYYSIAQLVEVRGFPVEAGPSMQKRMQLSTKYIQQLKLNTADTATLAAHPYISRKKAEKIVELRQQLRFTNMAALAEALQLTAWERERLAPYLLFD
jgi:DNA uptake protein ComE-like DNA-binding protein